LDLGFKGQEGELRKKEIEVQGRRSGRKNSEGERNGGRVGRKIGVGKG
jgi:hypothetical protein